MRCNASGEIVIARRPDDASRVAQILICISILGAQFRLRQNFDAELLFAGIRDNDTAVLRRENCSNWSVGDDALRVVKTCKFLSLEWVFALLEGTHK